MRSSSVACARRSGVGAILLRYCACAGIATPRARTLAANTTLYLFVIQDGGGASNATGYPVSFYTVSDQYRRFGPQQAQRTLLCL